MSNEHIGRRQAIGIGRESTSGTAVAATAWLPKVSGVFKPMFEKAKDDSAYGVIDEVYDSQTVKYMTEVELEGIARDSWIGLLLYGAMGQYSSVQCCTITGMSGGTPARGDSVTSATGTYVGKIKKILTIGAATYYFLSTTSGTLTDGATNLTNGTWTGGTVGLKTTVKGHFFERLNTNTHPSFTLYGSDPVSDDKAAYCMVDSFEIEFKVGDYAKFNAKFKGKKLATAGAQSPVYTADNPFLAKHAAVKFATNEGGLNVATASTVQRFKVTVNKNLVDVQAFGDTDIASIHNQQFTIAGDLEATYNAITFRDYVANSNKKAVRVSAINNEATAILSSGADSIYPSLYVDMARVSFEEWSRSNENNGLVNQTMGFAGEFDVSTAMTMEILLINTNATGY